VILQILAEMELQTLVLVVEELETLDLLVTVLLV
jgi:hypothetical protein